MRRYKINAVVIIPIAIITFLSGFAWGAKTERDIQRAVAFTPTSSVEAMATNTPTPVITPKPSLKAIPLPTVKPVEGEIYRATAYCACVKCCGKSDGITASGEKAREGVTIAADWTVLPKGTEVEIEGLGSRIVQDRGGAIRGNRIDVYFNSHNDALKFGVQDVLVTVKGDGK